MKESQKIIVIHQLDDKALDNDPGGMRGIFLLHSRMIITSPECDPST
jgi:hypothetical protein